MSIARIAVTELGYSKVTVNVQKPNAFAMVKGPGVEITRSRESFLLEDSPFVNPKEKT